MKRGRSGGKRLNFSLGLSGDLLGIISELD
jgi:hypothetical protein